MEETKNTSFELESIGRRKAVKKIVGGVTALAAYNMLPVRWEKPIIEQVFLPAHAQTSGEVIEEPLTQPAVCSSDYNVLVDNQTQQVLTVTYTNASGPATGTVADDDVQVLFTTACNGTTMTITSPSTVAFGSVEFSLNSNGTSETITVNQNGTVIVLDIQV